MRVSRIRKSPIIGVVLVLLAALLAGCGSVRIAYGNGPQLAWWWVDGYFDFNTEQSPVVRQRIDDLFAWHRSTQLAGYAPLLAEAAGQVGEPVTAGLVCRWQDRIRARLDPTLDHALVLAADLVPRLTDAQFKSLDKRYAKIVTTVRDDYLQPDPAERREASVKRAREYAERLYGNLGEAQLKVLEAGIDVSPFDPEAWLAERQRRQRDTVQTLRRLVADKADRDQRVAALRALVARVERSPDPEYRAYQARLTTYNCGLAAQLHNATTPVQRRKARQTLLGWEEDVRTLAN